MKRVLIASMIAASCVACEQQTAQKTSGNGKAEIEQTTIDLGELDEGDMAGARFKIKNSGNGPLTILNVETSCGCTEAHFDKKPIATESTETIEIVFDTRGLSGYQYKTAVIVTDGSESNRCKVAITAKIK